jgi:hypothetical protein
MRSAIFALLALSASAASAVDSRALATTGEASASVACTADVKRALKGYFRADLHATAVFLDCQDLGSRATNDLGLPVYYLWVRVSTSDIATYTAGVARVVIAKDPRDDFTGFIPKSEILVSPASLSAYLPPELLPKVLLMARTPQK